ncbi:hypothetical protein OENI_790002 [Oenococcus oeni]|nr:hypothetical protein OENI_790002 [Oenococcus oeni]
MDQLTNSNSTSKSSVKKAKRGNSYSEFTFKNNDFKIIATKEYSIQ